MIIDALTFTIDESTFADLLLLPGSETCKPLPGYRSAIRTMDGVFVCWDGYGFAEGTRLAKASGASVASLLRFANDGCRPTRIDVAFDSGTLTVHDVLRKFQSREYVSRLQFKRGYFSGSGTVETLYFGRRDGDCMVRCYDKAIEQGIDTTWTRLEYEFKGQAARIAYGLYRSKMYDDLRGFCASFFRLTEPYCDPVKAKLWEPFVKLVGGEVVKIPREYKSPSLARQIQFARNASKAIASWINHDGLIAVVNQILEKGKQEKCKLSASLLISSTRQERIVRESVNLRRQLRSWCLPLPGDNSQLRRPIKANSMINNSNMDQRLCLNST